MDQDEHQDFEDLADSYQHEGSVMGLSEAEMRAEMGDERYDEVVAFQDAVADANLRIVQTQGDLLEAKASALGAAKVALLAVAAALVVHTVRTPR